MIPFLKWPGGKRWLVRQLSHKLPEFDGCYFEPFLGAGAMFLNLAPQDALLSDANSELINLYKQIRYSPKKFAESLAKYQDFHSEKFYYEERDRQYYDNFERALQFLYLNRTCFNGIYRVNLDGKFNVPIGTKTNVILPTDDFQEIAKRLRSRQLEACDFEDAIDLSEEGDFIYADPPYTVRHNFNGFVKYNDKLFDWSDQERLRNCLSEASDRGAYVVVSNANHDSIRELYAHNWNFYEVSRTSLISADAEYRGKTTEILITNFDLSIPQSVSGQTQPTDSLSR